MTIKLNTDSLNELKALISKFEENELDLVKDVPKKLVSEFGYSCLANALMFKEPKIPQYNQEEISEFMKTHTFNTLDSLINYVKSVKGDINKLFAIFSWAALNIQYDTQSYFSGNLKGTTLEEVFKTKLAVCEGYALFVKEMAKRVNLNDKRITIKPYSNYAKGYSFDPLNPPKEVKSNHASVYLEIDGVPFIAEPTWAAGHIGEGKKFQWDYDPQLFLIPVYKTLCDHYPCDESKSLLPFEYPYQDYVKSCKVSPFDRYLKAEGIPFVNFESKNGYVEQFYSCTGPIDFVNFKIFVKKKKTFEQIDSEGISSYVIVKTRLPKHTERCRFQTAIGLPAKGFYHIQMFIDGPFAIEYYVNSLQKCSISIPLKVNLYHEQKFIPITPKTVLTSVTTGYALIRFAVAPKRADLLWDIVKLAKPNTLTPKGEEITRQRGRLISLNIPFDDERYEDQLLITFPSNGRYSVLVYLANDIGSYTTYMRYFFDVTGVTSENSTPINPASLMYKGRTFAPMKIFDSDKNEVIIKPNQNCFYVSKREQSLLIKTNKITDDIHLELRKEDKTLIFIKQDGSEGDFRRYSWTMPDEFGEFFLKGWINDTFTLSIPYVYSKDALKEPTNEENELLAELKSITDLDESKLLRKKREEEERRRKEEEKKKEEERKRLEQQKKKQDQGQSDVSADKKKSSKCCLLI